MRKIILVTLPIASILAIAATAQTYDMMGSGYGMMGGGWFGTWFIGLFYFVIGAVIFSLIFWWIYKLMAEKKTTK